MCIGVSGIFRLFSFILCPRVVFSLKGTSLETSQYSIPWMILNICIRSPIYPLYPRVGKFTASRLFLFSCLKSLNSDTSLMSLCLTFTITCLLFFVIGNHIYIIWNKEMYVYSFQILLFCGIWVMPCEKTCLQMYAHMSSGIFTYVFG